MNTKRTIAALAAFVGGTAAHSATPLRADPELRAARARAGHELRMARSEFAQHHPDRALVALRRAWDELAHVPGGEAFQDLVALDEAGQRARRSAARLDDLRAASAIDEALRRIAS